MTISRASTSSPASPAAACSGAPPIARSIPSCCGSSAPARCRRRARATCSRPTLSLSNKADQAVIADLIPDQPFIRTAPAFLVFLANGRRLPEISRMRGKPFPNDHLDQFFNAAVDAGIVLATFLRAADAVGLGTCPISVIRDHSAKVSEMLGAAAAGHSGGGHDGRLAVGGGPHQRAAVAFEHGARGQIRRRRSRRSASTPMTSAAPRSTRTSRAIRRAGAMCRSTAGRRTRRGNTACRSGRTSARSCGRRDSSWTRHADCSAASAKKPHHIRWAEFATV